MVVASRFLFPLMEDPVSVPAVGPCEGQGENTGSNKANAFGHLLNNKISLRFYILAPIVLLGDMESNITICGSGGAQTVYWSVPYFMRIQVPQYQRLNISSAEND